MDKDVKERVLMSEERAFLFRLSEKLHTKESNALVSIYELPARLRDQSAFDVLLQLHMQGKYNKLEELATILKEINRNDMAKDVNSFVKKNKKKHKPNNSCVVDRNLECVLKVTKLQFAILVDQIEILWEAANDARHRRIEEIVRDDIQSVSELMNKKFQYISGLLAAEKQAVNSLSPSSSISSTSSNGDEATVTVEITANPLESEIQAASKQLKSHSLPRDLPGLSNQMSRKPILPPAKNTNKPSVAAVQCTEDHISQPVPLKPPVAATTHSPAFRREPTQVHMPRKSPIQAKLPTKPAPPPKPKAKPTRTAVGPLQPPKVDNTPNRADQPVSVLAHVVHVNDDDDDYSELTYGTGDSGFSEAGEFIRPELRRELPVQPPSAQIQQPGEYAGLNTSTKEPDRYYKSARNCPRNKDVHAIMADTTTAVGDDGQDPEYVNLARRT